MLFLKFGLPHYIILLSNSENITLGTRGFSRVQREFSVLAEGRHIFGQWTAKIHIQECWLTCIENDQCTYKHTTKNLSNWAKHFAIVACGLFLSSLPVAITLQHGNMLEIYLAFTFNLFIFFFKKRFQMSLLFLSVVYSASVWPMVNPLCPRY